MKVLIKREVGEVREIRRIKKEERERREDKKRNRETGGRPGTGEQKRAEGREAERCQVQKQATSKGWWPLPLQERE